MKNEKYFFAKLYKVANIRIKDPEGLLRQKNCPTLLHRYSSLKLRELRQKILWLIEVNTSDRAS